MLQVNGPEIRRIRKAQSMSAEILAAKIKKTPQYLRSVERNQKRPSIDMLNEIAEALCVDALCLIVGAVPTQTEIDPVTEIAINHILSSDYRISLQVEDQSFPVPDRVTRSVLRLVLGYAR